MDKNPAGFQDPDHLPENLPRMGKIFHGYRADHRLEFMVPKGQNGIVIEVVDHIVG